MAIEKELNRLQSFHSVLPKERVFLVLLDTHYSQNLRFRRLKKSVQSQTGIL